MTENDKEKILDKIRKIFALAENNPSEQEAQSAIERGRALLVKYGLDMSEVDTDGEDDPFDTGHEVIEFEGKKLASWKDELLLVMADYFECKVYTSSRKRSRNRATFYGIAVNVQAAKNAYISIVNQIDALSKKYKITKENWHNSPNSWNFNSLKGFARTAKLEYKRGIISGLRSRFATIRRQERQLHGESKVTALAVRYEDAAKEHLDKVLKVKLFSSGSSRGNSYGTGDRRHRGAGVRDSARVNASKQIR
jgi:hypothetical protein